MSEVIKVYTHESVIHSQMSAIEKVLDRSVNFEITLNTKNARSNIQFEASEDEMTQNPRARSAKLRVAEKK